MRTSDFDYELPTELIAQRPAVPRTASRLMVLNRDSELIEHRVFSDLPDLLHQGDALVLNDSRVIPARLRARKLPSGGRVELLLLARRERSIWEVMVGGRGLSPGRKLAIEGGPEAVILENLGGPSRLIRFSEGISDQLDRIGVVPLPPYIQEPVRHSAEYQTVYADRPGSAAAPTAGLHFDEGLLERVEQRGISTHKLTLHIGLDTFAPVGEEVPASHVIHNEWCQISEGVAKALGEIRAQGGRVIAVGTTSVRTLETAAMAAQHGTWLAAHVGPTDLFILPGFSFKVVDALITNFHLPRSTLLMMVCAFAGRQRILDAYEVAKEMQYRFYSFGDAMLIL